MEDIKAYIESGVLELYVLGHLNADENLAVEVMCVRYPEIKAEVDAIENTLFNVSENLAVEPSDNSKAKFFSQIQFSDDEEEINDNTNLAAPSVVPAKQASLNFYKYSFAASLALLVVSIIAIINLSNSLKESRVKIAQLEGSNQKFANQVNFLNEKVNNNNEYISVLSDPDYTLVKLSGTENSPSSNLTIAFNAKDKKVKIDYSKMEMPKNDDQHQYQLWALVDGKPVDLGVFDADNQQIGFKTMKEIGKAQTFAVTLEPKGGSINPTLEKLMVIGNI